MSHIAKIEIQIKSLAGLEIAARELGGELINGQQSYSWFGLPPNGEYDGVLPAGFSVADLGKCDHAIRFPGAKYEIGVVARRDGQPGFTLLYDAFSYGGLPKMIGDNANKLRQEYSAAVASIMYRKQGFRVARTVKNGRIVMTATK